MDWQCCSYALFKDLFLKPSSILVYLFGFPGDEIADGFAEKAGQ